MVRRWLTNLAWDLAIKKQMGVPFYAGWFGRWLRPICWLCGHRWSVFGDESREGWFADVGGQSRDCSRCGFFEHRPIRG